MKKIIIAGSSGFIGSHLKTFLAEKGYEVIPLVRKKELKGIYWDPEEKIIDLQAMEKAECVINLCGQSIFGRWTKRKIERLFTSRLTPTAFLCLSLKQLKHPPKVYVGTSAIGFYGDRNDQILTEESESGKGIMASLCVRWESFPKELLKNTSIRTVLLRLGIVLGKKGGILAKMKTPFKWGLGLSIGNGAQFMSWIAMDDLLQIIEQAIESKKIAGIYNAVSPEPLTNKEFSKTLAHHFHRHLMGSIPQWVLKLLFLRGAEAFLSSTKVIPKNLEKSGYPFKYVTLKAAFKKYLPN